MKQGTGNSRMGDTKREPIAHAVSPAAVSEIGIHQVHTNGSGPQLYPGRGLEAPMGSCTNHEHGSQGKH